MENYSLLKTVLEPYTKISYSHGDIICKAVFDENSDSYLLVTLGWDGAKRIHGCLVHIEIINNKVWVQRDETEDGVTKELVAAGIPKHSIVLGFHPEDVRPHTGYAVA
ncbi:MAG: XisI protein [Leptolyngbyaceae cyanobacterium RM1_405_57]|nr:XisI protein [Leptolyngbyaceae cyanobacterium RM1_405_57]